MILSLGVILCFCGSSKRFFELVRPNSIQNIILKNSLHVCEKEIFCSKYGYDKRSLHVRSRYHRVSSELFTKKMTEIQKDQNKPLTFFYFAYSANLLKFRIKWFNPTAEFISIARLDNHRLDFIKYNHFWGGPTATIVPTANAHTWGVIWKVDKDDLISLDDQKGVNHKIYFPLKVKVHTPHMGDFVCRAYMKNVNPLPRGDHDPIPVERWPSFSYIQVMILGAEQTGLPEYYIESLKKLKDNGNIGGWLLALWCRRYALRKPCECVVAGRIPRKPLIRIVTKQ